MKETMEDRSQRLALYIIEHRSTVRAAAREFGISKSTVHKDVTDRLRQVDLPLYQQVKVVLDTNKQERHLRGGMATKRKYARIRT